MSSMITSRQRPQDAATVQEAESPRQRVDTRHVAVNYKADGSDQLEVTVTPSTFVGRPRGPGHEARNFKRQVEKQSIDDRCPGLSKWFADKLTKYHQSFSPTAVASRNSTAVTDRPNGLEHEPERGAIERHLSHVLQPNPVYHHLLKRNGKAIPLLRKAFSDESPEAHKERIGALFDELIKDKESCIAQLRQVCPIKLPEELREIFFDEKTKKASPTPVRDGVGRRYAQITLSFHTDAKILVKGEEREYKILVQARCHTKTSDIKDCPTNWVIDVYCYRGEEANGTILAHSTQREFSSEPLPGKDGPSKTLQTRPDLDFRRALQALGISYSLVRNEFVGISREFKELLVSFRTASKDEKQLLELCESAKAALTSNDLEQWTKSLTSIVKFQFNVAKAASEIRPSYLVPLQLRFPDILGEIEDVNKRSDLCTQVDSWITEQTKRCQFLAAHPLAVCADRLLPALHQSCYFELLPENAEWFDKYCKDKVSKAVDNDPAHKDGYQQMVKK